MKIGTVPKITVGAVAIIGLGLIGTHHFILSKEDSSSTVEIVTSTSSEATLSVPQTNATRKTIKAPRRAEKPQISAEEMEQIENFFAQLEEANIEQGLDMAEVGVAGDLNPTITDDYSDDQFEISSSGFALTPENQSEVDSIIQRIYDGTDEYRGLMEIVYSDVPWNPEVHEQRIQAEKRIDELDAELPNFVAHYYMITRDMDGVEQLLSHFDGVMEIEFTPAAIEGELFSMEVMPIRYLN